MKSALTIQNENRLWAESIFKKIDKKFSVVSVRNRDILPDGTDENGRFLAQNPAGGNWTLGFFGGLNVLMYNHTKNEDYLKTAKRSEELMDASLKNFPILYHDVGFMWHILSGALYRITGDEDSKNRELFTASSLFSRFVLPDEGTGFIRAWNAWGKSNENYNWSIIDCLMNLPSLYHASEIIGDDRFTRIAKAHADMALRDHLRPDGSVAHIVEHSRETGECVATYGGQGIGVGSSWSRGCSWALYGFVISYLHTKEERYLDGAKRAANYFISNVCDDWLPRVDFRAPAEPVYYDSTAGCIAACGLIELARALPEDEGGMYMNAAVRMLRAMTEMFADFDDAHDQILHFGTIRYPMDEKYVSYGVHKDIIYADYYYTEAILKLIDEPFFPW